MNATQLRRAWEAYFPERPFNEDDPYVVVIHEFVTFFVSHGPGGHLLNRDDMVRGPVPLDLQRLFPLYPELEEHLTESAELISSLLGMAVALVRLAEFGPPFKPCRVRPFNPPGLMPMRELKASVVGRLACIRGNAVRVSVIRPQVLSMDFLCPRCQCQQRVHFEDGRFEPPSRCPTDKCRAGRFEPVHSSAVTRDWQKIKLQELEDDSGEPGRIPRTVEVELSEDLVDACVPGDVVTVVGVVKRVEAAPARGGGRGRGAVSALYVLYVDALGVSNQRSSDGDDAGANADGTASQSTTQASGSGGGGGGGGGACSKLDVVQFTRRDMAAIRDVATSDGVLGLVVASLCPAIFGHEMVKLGLALALFGGTRQPDSAQRVAVRGDPHVLVVGDPGMGKSQMLQAVAALSPRGVYVCGNTTSTTGLTVTMVRDQLSGEFALEAGALVLGDQGLCCIDEFDKMGAEQQALLEAMEQQSISIAKAGVCCTLSARTSIVAAANPAGGHYNRGKTVAENLRMGSALLSRFDLLFILLDTADQAKDQLLSEHIMAAHVRLSEQAADRWRAGGVGSANAPGGGAGGAGRRRRGGGGGASQLPASIRSTPTAASGASCRAPFARVARRPGAAGGAGIGGASSMRGPDGRRRLEDVLREEALACTDPIPLPVLRKYIAYARRYVHPQLSAGAARVLRDFYLSLRRAAQEGDAVPITTRQLESLIRLAQARAKLELRELVSEGDAREVVEVMQQSMVEVCTDEFGGIDFGRATGMSLGKQVKAMVRALGQATRDRNSPVFSLQEMKEIGQRLGLDMANFAEVVDTMNQQTYILSLGNKNYKLLTS